MKNKYIYALLGLLLIILVGFLYIQKDNRKISYYTINGKEALEMVKKEDVTIIDVRTNIEYKSGHIKDAINIPVDKLNKDTVASIPDKTKYYLVYCRSGSRSREAVRKLSQLGYKRVYDLGSISKWKEDLVKE